MSETDEHQRRVGERYAAAAARITAHPTVGAVNADEADKIGQQLYAGPLDPDLTTIAAASIGCGNPVAVAEPHPGETVVDLGSGAGLDVLLSARRVGPAGCAIGLDSTDEMLELARRNADEAGVTNAEFLPGTIENIPLPSASVDVVISNCVIALSADKSRVFAEIHRVLRPGGRVGISDVIADEHLTDEQRAANTSNASPTPRPAPTTRPRWVRPGWTTCQSRSPTRSATACTPRSSRPPNPDHPRLAPGIRSPSAWRSRYFRAPRSRSMSPYLTGPSSGPLQRS